MNNNQYKMHGMYIKKNVRIIFFICILIDLMLDSNLSQNMLQILQLTPIREGVNYKRPELPITPLRKLQNS